MKRKRVRELEAQAALEFVMILPIAVVLLGFAVDVTGVWNAKSRVHAAAAECARAFSADPGLTEDELALIAADASGLGASAKVRLDVADIEPKDIVMRSGGSTQSARFTRKSATITVTCHARTMIPATAAALGSTSDGMVPLSSSSTAIISDLGAS